MSEDDNYKKPNTEMPSTTSRVQFYKGGSLAKVERRYKKQSSQTSIGGQRGVIHTFSRASRLRLLRQVAKIRRDAAALFITLTYPDEFPNAPARWKRDLKTFAERLKRYKRDASFIWRLELQTRKSGKNSGKLAPHYHLIMYGMLEKDSFDIDEFRLWLSASWYATVASKDEKHLRAGTNCTEMRSWRGAMNYAAKYLGKIDDNIEIKGVGRYWGVYFRNNLPEAEKVELDLTDKEAMQVIRMFRKFSGIKSRSYSSLTTFLDAEQWYEGIARLYDKTMS